MRIPTTAILGNLRWTTSGTVWADWILTGLTYRFANIQRKKDVRDAHTALYRALPGQALLLGINASIDPTSVVEKMLDGVDLDECPLWAEDVLATFDTLSQIPLGQRLYWLSVPLGNANLAQTLHAAATASKNHFLDTLGVTRPLPPQPEIERRLKQAAEISARIPSFDPKPATAAQMMWLHQHMVDRGMTLDDPMPKPGDIASDLATSSPRATIGEPLVDEGGRSDFASATDYNPLAKTNRLVKITDIHRIDGGSSYQALAVLTKPPTGGMVFPGSELLGRIDESGLNIDWAQRIQVIGRDTTTSANQRALEQLRDQTFHTGGTDQDNIAANTDLAMRESALHEYVSVLASDDLELETRITTLFAVGAPDRESLREQVIALQNHVEGWHHKLIFPLGHQEDLWWAMHPGAPTSPVVKEFEQITSTRNAAGLVPMISTIAGDNRGTALAINLANGPLLAVDLPCGPSGLIMHDLDGASERDTSGSIAFAAESGAGKSVALKKIADSSLDQGGGAIVVDRTEMGEYALWAQARGDVAVVEIDNPRWSFDPLRLFPGAEGTRVTQSFLTMLLNISAAEDLGTVLSEVLDPSFRSQHNLASQGDVLNFLLEHDDPQYLALGRKMRVFSRNDLGRVVFDPTLPVPDTSQSMVIRVNRLQLPNAEQLANEHLFRQLSIAEIFGRAYYALIAGYARTVCFRDRERQWVLVMDELTAQIVSPEVEGYLVEFNIDGRKHRAALAVGAQFVADGGLGSPRLANSFPTRVVMRMRNEKQARPALEWLLGHTPEPELVEIITTASSPITPRTDGDDYVEEHRRGEMVMVDAKGRPARGKILAASQVKRREAAMATGFGGAK